VIKKVQKIDINENIIINIFFCVSLSHKVLLSHKVCMVSHKVVLSHNVVLSWQALFRVAQVVSLRTSGDCGHPPQPWHEYSNRGKKGNILDLLYRSLGSSLSA